MESNADPERGTLMYSLLPTGTCVIVAITAGVTASETFASAATSSRGPEEPPFGLSVPRRAEAATVTMMTNVAMTARTTAAPPGEPDARGNDPEGRGLGGA